MKFLLAKKLGMTTIYQEGNARNVTLLEAGKNVITQVRTMEKDGYTAIQVGLIDGKDKEGKKILKKVEYRVDSIDGLEEGKELGIEQFVAEEKAKISGVSKGKGFQGVVKRHGFAGSPATHGHKHDLRAPGSIGAGWPQHVIKGMRMAGRMGTDNVTTRNIKVVMVDAEKNMIAVEGAVPGNNGAIVSIKA